MRGSAQLAGAHNPLGARLAQEKGAPGLRRGTLSEERPGELEGEGGCLEGCAPHPYPRRPPGDRFSAGRLAPPFGEVGWAAKPGKGRTAAGGLVWWGLGSIRGPLRGPSPTREGSSTEEVGREAEFGDPSLY